jgi:glycosyltransferase involved in cell wall biosynthesis
LLGWWLVLKTGSVPKESRVLLFFPNLPIRLGESGKAHWTGGPTTRLMAWLFARLRGDVESGRLVLGVETHAMRRALEGLIRMPVVYLPHPVPAKPGGEESRVERRESSKCEDVLTTTGKAGALEEEHPKVGPKGEGVGTSESKDTEGTEDLESGLRLAGQAGASESGALAIKLVELPVSESLIRFAAGPTEALDAGRSTLDTEASASPIVFGCYGAARWEKGSDIFQEAIKLILKNEVASKKCRVASVEDKSNPVTHYSLPATTVGRPLRFAIQWVEDFRDGEGNLVSIDPWLREHSQVEVIGRYFEGDEYERRLAQTDVMVLPYRSPYRLRVSRVVIEAIINGMPVIATEGTTLFEQAEEHGVVVGCEEGDAESLAGAMLEVADRFEILRASAEGKVNAAAKSFSVGYFRDLLHSKMCFTSMSPS